MAAQERIPMAERRAALLIAGLAAAVSLAARLAWRFDGLYGEDAFAYFRYAPALGPWLLLRRRVGPGAAARRAAAPLPLAGWLPAAGGAGAAAIRRPGHGWAGRQYRVARRRRGLHVSVQPRATARCAGWLADGLGSRAGGGAMWRCAAGQPGDHVRRAGAGLLRRGALGAGALQPH